MFGITTRKLILSFNVEDIRGIYLHESGKTRVGHLNCRYDRLIVTKRSKGYAEITQIYRYLGTAEASNVPLTSDINTKLRP